jgi:type III pantothenate kinase
MFLACDIGNSKIKAGLFSENKLVESFCFQSIEQVADIYIGKNIPITGISSVVPESYYQLINFLDSKSFHYHRISVDSRLNLKMKYKTPETLGSDRICSAEGAYLLNGKMNEIEIILSIDFGTATTVNIVHYPGEFAGGVIAPGINMMGEALHSHTAQLPQVGFRDYRELIGDSTKSSIASGLINSSLGMIDRILNFIKGTYPNKTLKIFLTGGNAEKLVPYIDFDFVYEKNLVLYGIKAITDLNLSDLSLYE